MDNKFLSVYNVNGKIFGGIMREDQKNKFLRSILSKGMFTFNKALNVKKSSLLNVHSIALHVRKSCPLISTRKVSQNKKKRLRLLNRSQTFTKNCNWLYPT
jgi:hypothetical protein